MQRLLLVIAVLVAAVGCNGRNDLCAASCDVNATCTKTAPFVGACACNTGFSGDGIHCAEIDSCLTSNGGCDVNATCTKTGPGTSTCTCTDGYSGDGVTCFVGENSCQTNNGGCDVNATCAPTGPSTNTCACNTGYSGDGTSCTATNSCLAANGGCDANATCTSTGPATNSCACNTLATAATAPPARWSTAAWPATAAATPTPPAPRPAPAPTLAPATKATAATAPPAPGPSHTLVISFSGSGSVGVNPSGASCDSGSCSYDLPEGTVVTLTASPATDWTFGIWSGCDTVDGQTCTVTMSDNKTIATGFNFNTFTLAASYEGSGSITSNPTGLDCGGVCSASFDMGSTVRLIAVPDSSAYYVSSWTGCTSFSGATCDVTMNSNMSVKAIFSPSPTGWVDACEQAGGTSYYSDGWHDDEFTQVDIGFDFSFYGQSYTQAYVSTNALVTFDSRRLGVLQRPVGRRRPHDGRLVGRSRHAGPGHRPRLLDLRGHRR